MQDPRLRLFSTAALSVAAFVSVGGALLVFLWWLFFTPGPRIITRRGPGFAFLLVGGVALILQLSMGGGFSYFLRFSAILLIAVWAYAVWKPGEFLETSVWLIGQGAGFDLGLLGEMSMQSLDVAGEDLSRIITAQRIKGTLWGWRNLGPGIATLVLTSLRRAENQAVLLAVRGYRRGGSLNPAFQRGKWDKLAVFSAILILIAAFLPVSDIFYTFTVNF